MNIEGQEKGSQATAGHALNGLKKHRGWNLLTQKQAIVWGQPNGTESSSSHMKQRWNLYGTQCLTLIK
jgi:hypothetical protein